MQEGVGEAVGEGVREGALSARCGPWREVGSAMATRGAVCQVRAKGYRVRGPPALPLHK